MTTVMALLAILFSPVLLAVLLGSGAILFVLLATVLCPGFGAKVSGECQNCHAEACPMALMLIMFVAFPLGLVSIYLFKRRRRSRPSNDGVALNEITPRGQLGR